MSIANSLLETEHDPSGAQLSIREVRDLVKDLLEPNPLYYWLDFLTTIAVSQTGFWFFAASQCEWWLRTLGFLTAVVAFYRATFFMHELAHFREGTFRGFRIAWNALCGIPFLMPSFLYEDHRFHHVNHHYGTAGDAEYLPLGRGTTLDFAKYFLQLFFVPLFGITRFVILTPFTWVSTRFRNWVWQRSSVVTAINWSYRRPLPDDPCEWRAMRILETCCFVVGIAFFSLFVLEILPWMLLPQSYAVFVSVTALNYLRSLGAHRYLSDGEPMDYRGQVLDSYTIPTHAFIGAVWGPLGMRYHALHHMVPSLPYYNLGKAHRRLVKSLPANSAYHATIRRSLWAAVAEVVGHARAAHTKTSGAPPRIAGRSPS